MENNASGMIKVRRRRTRLMTFVAFAAVILIVVALALAPALMLSRLEQLSHQLDVRIGPVARGATELRLILHRQIADLRGFVYSGDSTLLERYRQSRLVERQTFSALFQSAHAVNSDVAEKLGALHAVASRWQARGDSVAAGHLTREQYGIPQQLARSDTMLLLAADLQAAIDRETELEMQRGNASIITLRPITLWLGLLGLSAVVAVVIFARRQARLADQLAQAALEESRLRQESERRRDEIERITESRARLMRGFSHDVKNPLGAADGYLQLLEDGVMGDLAEPQMSAIGKSRRSLRAALHLIEDLLELSRAEAGHIEFDCVPLDLRAVAEEAGEEYRAQAEAKGLSMSIELGSLPIVNSDPMRVRQVLGNLISNAVKYTEQGHLKVRACVATGNGPRSGKFLMVDVADTGAGIPEERQEMIFQEFTRLEPGSSRGAGVGLAISRRIARALGGDITVQSKVGQGSVFRFWLPLNGGKT